MKSLRAEWKIYIKKNRSVLSSVIETDYEPPTGYTQTFQKPGRTGNQQGSEKQK